MAGTALPARAAVTSRGITIPDFYTPPATPPAADGALVRTEPLPPALALPGRATRIMYKSTDSAGNPVAVTGAYPEPAAGWKGPRPPVVLAPGTMGQGDQCSTSLALQRGLVLGACRARRRPHGQARALASSWCRLGGSVVYAARGWTVSRRP
ncbi:hypothetical protein [Actinoplanes xinjiangensis]|uniref:hypothetical protein n=1 Tax=Actinoplanes xinjiangensis TaxID=512350 RepID=UPI0034439D8B